MLSISKPLHAAGAEKYYDRDNYYLESQGYWHGSLAQEFNLSGEITADNFKNLLRGKNVDGVPLIGSADKEDRRAGVDLTFSAPKSVSILAYQDSRIQAAFDRALHDTLNYAEDQFTQTRHKRNGEINYETTGSAAFAIFNHRISRELDPQLHAHCVMMNLTQSETGKIMSMDNAKFYENKMYLGQYFRNQLAIEMQNLGYQINVTDRNKGFFEVKGVPNEITEMFSKRREQVTTKLEELRKLKFKDLPEDDLARWAAERLENIKHTPFYPERLQTEIQALRTSNAFVYVEWEDAELAALATTGSRIPKRNVTEEYVIEQMNNALAKKNLTLASLTESVKALVPRMRTPKPVPEIIAATIESMTKTEAAFTREAFMKKALKTGLGDYSYNDLNAEFERMLVEKNLVHLRDEYKASKGETALYTTAELQAIEKESIEICRTSKTDIRVDDAAADTYIRDTNHVLHIGNVFPPRGKKFEKQLAEHESLTEHDRGVILKLQKQYKTEKENIQGLNELFEANPNVKNFFYENGYGFTPGQKNALRQMVATQCQFSVIQGDAGTGKSFSMMYAKQLLESQGYSVRGLAPTGKATDELAKAAKLEKSMTIHKFVQKWEKSPRFRKQFEVGKECFVVDESGMIGTKMANKFIKICKDIDAKAVFVGDRKQFAAVEAGKFFSDLQDKAGVDKAEMTDVMRQKTDQTKGIVKAISDKKFDLAFNYLRGYRAADKAKAKAKHYRVGQRLMFDDNHRDRKLAGINAEITQVTKSRLVIRYTTRYGQTMEAVIDPREEHNNYTLFKHDDENAKDPYTNCISEIKDEDKRLQAVADDYLQCYAEKKDALVITATNDDRQKLNTIIRKTLVEQNQVRDVGEYMLHEPKSVSATEFADSYSVGQIIELTAEKFKGEITEIDIDQNTLTIKDTNGDLHTFNPVDFSKNPPSVFNPAPTTLGINEKIAFLKNAKVKTPDGKEVDIRNGQLATITSLDKDGNLVARIGEGCDAQDVKFNINTEYNNFATAYALSSHKSQGMTVDRIIWHANTAKEISTNSFYVAITRCKSEVAVYTDDTEKLIRKAQQEQEKYSTLDDELEDDPVDEIIKEINATTNPDGFDPFDEILNYIDTSVEVKPEQEQQKLEYSFNN